MECLLAVDKKEKISVEDKESKKTKELVSGVMRQLVSGIATVDELFVSSTLVPSGSYFDGTKINRPDEFDYVLEVYPENYSLWVDRVNYGGRSTDLYEAVGDDGETHGHVLSSEELIDRFKYCIDYLLPEILLPEHLVLVDPGVQAFNTNHSHSLMFNFVYMKSAVMSLTVRLTLAICINIRSNQLLSLMETILDCDYLADKLHASGQMRYLYFSPTSQGVYGVSNSKAEQTAFMKLHHDSVPKVVLRLCKVLAARYSQVVLSEGRLSRSNQTALQLIQNDVQKRNPSFDLFHYFDATVGGLFRKIPTETSPEWLEVNCGLLSLLDPYVFKKVIMTMNFADMHTHQDEWRYEDVDDLLRIVLGIVNDLGETEGCQECVTNELNEVSESSKLKRMEAIAEGAVSHMHYKGKMYNVSVGTTLTSLSEKFGSEYVQKEVDKLVQGLEEILRGSPLT